MVAVSDGKWAAPSASLPRRRKAMSTGTIVRYNPGDIGSMRVSRTALVSLE
jgi:hypothetical protein